MKTYKGADFPKISDQENWHGKPLGSNAAEVLTHLENKLMTPSTLGQLKPQAPVIDCQPMHLIGTIKLPCPPPYKKGDKVSYSIRANIA